MANISSINGNPIVLGLDGLTDEAKSALGNGTHCAASDSLLGTPATDTWARRTSTGSGMARVESVQGAAVVWNQLVPLLNDSAWQKSSNVTVTTGAEQNSVVITSTTDATGTKVYRLPNDFNPTAGHVFYVACDVETSADYSAMFGIFAINGTTAAGISAAGGTPRGRFATIATPSSVSYVGMRLNNNTTSGHSATFKNLEVLDLTQMFGAGNEPATVAEFERMFPEPYYPYSAPTLKPVRIAGIASTDAQGGELDGVEWETQTLRAAGSVRDELTAGELVTRVGVYTFTGSETAYMQNWRPTDTTYGALFPLSVIPDRSSRKYENNCSAAVMADLDNQRYFQLFDGTQTGFTMATDATDTRYSFIVRVPKTIASTQAELMSWLAGKTVYYELATPTTTPISPALPMTYRVEQGGTESIVVPEGEISAAPVLTVAEGESASELVMDALAAIATPDGPTATANHAVNTYLTMQGKLYKVTRAIAVGEQITPNTNVTETTVMAELLALAN